MIRFLLFAMAAIGVSGFLWVRSCSGPDPDVLGVALSTPAAEGEPYIIDALVLEGGAGPGVVRVVATLRSEAGTYQGETTVSLPRDEAIHALVEIAAPPGDYTAEVDVQYPPE